MAEWLCSGLQSRGRRFDSDPSLHFYLPFGPVKMNARGNHRSLTFLFLFSDTLRIRYRRVPINNVVPRIRVRFYCAWMHRCREGHEWPGTTDPKLHFSLIFSVFVVFE